MAVAGVLAVADVGHDQQFRNLAAQCPDSLLHDAVIVVGAGGDFVLRFRQSEEDYAADAERLHLGAFLHQLVDRELVIIRHGADLAADAFARANEERQNELLRIEARFAHEIA